VDALKFAGGSFSPQFAAPSRSWTHRLVPQARCAGLGPEGFIEYVLTQGPAAVENYIGECKEQRFDIIEISSGFITIPIDDLAPAGPKGPGGRLESQARGGNSVPGLAGLPQRLNWKPKAPGPCTSHCPGSTISGCRGLHDHDRVRRDHENVKVWRTERPPRGLSSRSAWRKVMFEAADPEVFAWYVKNYGPEVNLFVDHSQIVQLQCLRSGIWGTKSLWGRVPNIQGQRW